MKTPSCVRLFTVINLLFFNVLSNTAIAQQCCDVPGWQWVVEVTIDNTYPGNTAHANYPVLLNIDTQTPIAAGHMDPNIGADIRFTDNTCGPFLSYWLEGGINTTATQVWVLVPSLPANAVTTLYMYYGNPGAAPMSNMGSVFTNIYTLNSAVTLSGVQTYDWIDIQAGGTINLAQGATLTLNARKVTVAGTINGNNCGFGPAAGPGAGADGGGSRGGGGGGYGGQGGSGGCPAGNSGPVNGTPNGTDINMGSGGGGSDCNPNVGGGGAVTIQGGVVEITGTINMNGGSMGGNCSEEAAGAGSGGGILVQADYITGTGTMNARGGNGQNSNNKEAGGGGGGGRIKLFFCSDNSFSGTTNVTKGLPGNGDQCSANDAADGTSTVNPSNTCQVIVFGPENPIRIVPTASFNTTNVCLGTDAEFFDATTIPLPAIITSYDWDFGDGSAHGTTQNPTHTYLTAGTYTVVLTVTSDEGCVDSYNADIVISPVPVADFTFVSQCYGTAIQFTDASTVAAPANIIGWAWDFDNDLSPDDMNQNPTFNFPAAGNYTVGLGVQTDGGCVGAITHSVTVYANPVASFTAASVCEGAVTTFVNTSTGAPNAWTWDFGDGPPLDNTQNPTHTYAASGSYNVQLTVTTANGCTDDVTLAVDVNPIPVAAFTGTDVCRTIATDFTDNSSVAAPSAITDWEWDFQNNGSVDNTTQNPSFTYPADGTFDVLLTVTSTGGCTDDELVTVTVYPSATADFTFTNVCLNLVTDFTDQSTITTGNIVGWAWTFGDGPAVDNNQNTTHTYASANTYTATLLVTSNNGCTSTASQDVMVYPLPNADFSATSVCEGEPNVFTDLSTVSSGTISAWRYEFGDNSISSSQNPSHTYLTTNTYNVELLVTTGQGCLDSITKPVTVYPLPVVDFEAVPANGCMPLDVQFNDLSTVASGSVVSWSWNIQGAGTTTDQDTAVTFDNAGQYDVTLSVTTDKGCSTTLTRTDFVDVHPKPFPAFTFIPQITEILYPEITFTDHSSGGPTQWSWHFGTGDSSQIENPVYNYPDTGRFIVLLEVFNQYGCSDTVSHQVIITPSFTIYVPNAFSPNDDGVNDIFMPKGIGWRDYELRVYSRSGNQVFSSFDHTIGWNGKVRDADEFAIADVYVWRVYVRDKNNRMQDFKGTVTLVR